MLRGDPDGLAAVRFVPAFPQLRFQRPLWVGSPPGRTNELWVLEQDGRIWAFENRLEVTERRLVLDISEKVYRRHNEEGLLGLAFHPGFARNGRVYIHYSADGPRRGVVARLQLSADRTRLDPTSESLVLEQAQPWGNHNGGGLEFGPDGYLYVSFGDGGAANDPLGSGQDVSTWLGAMLRIDVDAGERYAVPTDNPFIHRAGARPEIWAYGLRNVWRFSFDRVTGALWAGDVGQNAWEEIDILTAGGNYGWNAREGHEAFRRGVKQKDMIDPVVSHPVQEARSITGGYVYRGSAVPSLQGAYVYADYATGWMWALRWSGSAVTQQMRLGRGGPVSSFGEDGKGELLFASFDGRLYGFAPVGAESEGVFPRRLSATGLFLDTQAMVPNPALIPYSVNVPLWADGAEKSRYVMLPRMERIRVDRDGSYRYPIGTIFVKTFLAGEFRLETRLLVLRENGWAGFTYAWDDAQEDAVLLDARVNRPLSDALAGQLASKVWTYPGRADCTSCHTAQAGFILGFRSEQLDRPRAVGAGKQENQLQAFAHIGLFDGEPRSDPAWPDWTETRTDPTAQVRAYLDANCAYCHQPGGTGNARIDLRYGTPLGEARLVNEAPGQGDLGVLGARVVVPGQPKASLLYLRMLRTDAAGMPNLAHNAVDPTAAARVRTWIESLR
ncbi:MAG: PQQ-dependent sugar dehydrogenase [Planctomycetota bacterium]|nr:PQQ-dependent sugar dehydrogenase [Planctomycetota bacterium]